MDTASSCSLVRNTFFLLLNVHVYFFQVAASIDIMLLKHTNIYMQYAHLDSVLSSMGMFRQHKSDELLTNRSLKNSDIGH